MLYQLVKRENIGAKDKDGIPYDPFSGDDKFYYDLVEDIHEFSKKSGMDYIITGTIAFALFFGKTFKSTKDLDMHINPEDLEKWICFFENLFGKVNIVKHDINRELSCNYGIEAVINGKSRKVELFTAMSARFIRQNKDFGLEQYKNINLSIKNNIRVKTVYLRPKDLEDIHYYNLNFYYFLYRGMGLLLICMFTLLRQRRFWLLFTPAKHPRLRM